MNEANNNAQALHTRGVIAAKSQQWDEALQYVLAAIQIQPENPAYFNSLGNIYRHLNQFDQAISAFQQAIHINPNYAVAYNNLGNIYYQQHQVALAESAYEKAITLNPDYQDAKNNLCNLYYQTGMTLFEEKKFLEARECFEAVIANDHHYFDINQCLANTALELGDHEKAMHYYFLQLEKNPLFETYYNLGVLYMMKERLNDALNYFHQAIQKNPHDLATQLNCGNIYLKKNDIAKATVFYQQANILKPNDPEIQHILLALEQKNIPANAPPAYIMHLFDQYAPYYDKHLTEYLDYQVPHTLLETVRQEYGILAEKSLYIVDLGCGTGLCGELFKAYAKKLVGVDLSENMLAIARNKKIYDELHCDDIVHGLEKMSQVDLIIAADVFTYCGDLTAIFKNAKKALISGGFFAFTVEKTFEHDYILQTSIRYAHSKDYLESLAHQYQFEILRLDNIALRKQKNALVDGYLVLCKST